MATLSTTPVVSALHNGHYHHKPDWYRQFLYEKERERGQDHIEDLASPGLFQWTITKTRAVLIFSADGFHPASEKDQPHVEELYESLRSAEEKRRKSFSSPLHKSADAYFVKRGKGKSLMAGYPWLTDWGRDTFIALAGTWDRHGTAGRQPGNPPRMVPDARRPGNASQPFPRPGRGARLQLGGLHPLVHPGREGILFSPGARAGKRNSPRRFGRYWKDTARASASGLGLDSDGLLWAGEGDSALTWMDSRVHGNAVTPRVGKPVEVEALWLNALAFALTLGKNPDPEWKKLSGARR